MQTITHTTTIGNHAEAPCAINARIDVDGRCCQVTGRGATPEEAAANFRGLLAALQPIPAPVLSRAERVGPLLACGLAKAAGAQDWALAERLAKAAVLVLSDAVEPGNRAGLVAVRSQTHPETWYEVEGKHCTCQDAQRHADRACKHRLAVMMTAKLAE